MLVTKNNRYSPAHGPHTHDEGEKKKTQTPPNDQENPPRSSHVCPRVSHVSIPSRALPRCERHCLASQGQERLFRNRDRPFVEGVLFPALGRPMCIRTDPLRRRSCLIAVAACCVRSGGAKSASVRVPAALSAVNPLLSVQCCLFLSWRMTSRRRCVRDVACASPVRVT